jgi:hypothetical protein
MKQEEQPPYIERGAELTQSEFSGNSTAGIEAAAK